MRNKYNDKSIVSISPLEFCRLRPGVYCGSTEYSTQLLVEIVANAIDEFRAGNGDKIEVKIEDDGTCTVRDYGQGFIVNKTREDGETVLQASFDVLNTSGKFDSDGVYSGTAVGLNGIGAKLTNFLSHWLEVTTYRDGKGEYIKFEEGVFNKRALLKQENNATGTCIKWKPNEQFFENPSVDINKIKNLFYIQTCICSGLTIELIVPGESEPIVYYSKNGLNDLVDDKVKNIELINNRLNLKYAEQKYKLNLILTYTSNYALNMISYVNTGETDSGPHITQIKTMITREFNKFFKDKKWLKDKDDNFSGDDIQEGMFIITDITAPNISYDAQTKSRIVKIDMAPFITPLSDAIGYWLINNEKDAKLIFEKICAARTARENAKKARDAVRNGEKKKSKALKFDSKLADCYSKDRSKCEIYITEGDSASGNLKTARNNEFQAVMPIRGKILNTQKATLTQIQQNAEIMTMIEAFGLRIDTKTMKITYDEDDLRYGKIIIMSDADVDGAHIKNLFYTFIWNFCPELIKDGYIYAGVPPLYKVTIGKKYKYIKNDEALEEFKKSNKDKSFIVNRMKGLGEMDVDETEETLTDPNNRIIKQITVNDVKSTNELFENLMGSGTIARKDYIKEHSNEATYNAE